MVNASNLASIAGAAAGAADGAAAGAAAGPEVASAKTRRTPTRTTAPVARSQAVSTPIASALERVLFPAIRAAAGTVVPRGGRASAVAGYAPAPAAAKSSTSTSSTSSKSALSFLSDPKLSIEEKLMRLMAYLNGKWEKEMEAKMKQVAGQDLPASSTSSTKKKSSGLFCKIAGAVSGLVGGEALKAVSGFLKMPMVKSILGKVAGPVLAAGASALGFPAAAPLLLQYGSKVVDVVDGVASAASSSCSSGTSGTSGTKEMSDSERQLLMTQIQRLQDKQKEMFGLVSNILKGNHDTRMAVINNVR